MSRPNNKIPCVLPVVHGDSQWGKSLSEDIKNLIAREQASKSAADLLKTPASDAEVVALFFSLSLSAPLDHDAAAVYIHTASKVIRALAYSLPPGFDEQKTLTSNQKRMLDKIRADIRETQRKHISALARESRAAKRSSPDDIKTHQSFCQDPAGVENSPAG